jgi:hypothetical protein
MASRRQRYSKQARLISKTNSDDTHERSTVSLAPGLEQRIAHSRTAYFFARYSSFRTVTNLSYGRGMIQETLFHESIYDAMRAIVERAGGAKAVGVKLRPSKTADEAGRWVLDCLNPSRAERFAPEDSLHLLRIGREIGYHGAMAYIAQEAGYRCDPIEPQDEQAQLQRDFIESVKASQKIASRLERLSSFGSVKAVA